MTNAAVLAGQLRSRKKQSVDEEQNTDADRRDSRLRAVNGAGSSGRAIIRKTVIKKIAKPINGAKIATNRLLSASWLSLIPSFGLTLIWINVHAFLHTLFPSIFGKLGEEWLPGQAQAGDANKSAESANAAAGMLEKAALVLLDFLAVIMIIGAITIIMALIDSVFGVFGWLFDWFGEGEKVYIDNNTNEASSAAAALGTTNN